MIYCIVLVSSILIMLFTCRCSYPQLAHLPLVRDLVDVENRSLSNAKMAFGVDSQIREAVKAKEPAAMLSVSEMTPLAGSRHGNE